MRANLQQYWLFCVILYSMTMYVYIRIVYMYIHVHNIMHVYT